MSLAYDLDRAVAEMAQLPKPCVGIVCRPQYVARVRKLAEAEASKESESCIFKFAGVPVYEKADQEEDIFAFYDREALWKHFEEK